MTINLLATSQDNKNIKVEFFYQSGRISPLTMEFHMTRNITNIFKFWLLSHLLPFRITWGKIDG